MRRKITKELEEEIIKLYIGQSSLNDISKRFAMNDRTIKIILISNNIPIRGSVIFKGKIPVEEHNTIINYYLTKQLSIKEIAKKYDVTRSSISYILRMNGVEVIQQRTITEEYQSKIIELYKNGISTIDIGELFNFSPGAISRFLKLQGIIVINKGESKSKTILTREQEISLCEDYKNLISFSKLEDKYHIGWRKLEKIIRKNGIATNDIALYRLGTKHDNNYTVWVNKYGKEEADKRMDEYKKKASINSSGKNNPMYGKPSPNGSGQGWKGWYKDFYFRSLRELSYVLYLDANNIKWKTAEKKKFRIPYKNWEGTERTYAPDFLVEDKKLIEIKPKKLQKSPLVMAKSAAAIEFCKNNDLVFEIIDFPINTENIKIALDNNLIKFARDYKERFLEYLTKQKK